MHPDRECPRYCPERALPAKAYLPSCMGPDEKPVNAYEACQWNGRAEDLAESVTFRWGADLFNHGFYWEAHEAWEELWIHAKPETGSRYALQALIQVAAAMLKSKIPDWSAYDRISKRALAKLTMSVELGGREHGQFEMLAFAEQVREFGTKRGIQAQVPLLRIS